MTPRKNRPVLFEVVSRTQRGRATTARPPAPSPPVSTSSTATPIVPSKDGGARPPASEPSYGALTFFGFEDGQLFLVFRWFHLAIIGVILAGLLVGMYQLGKRSAGTPAAAPGPGSQVLGGAQSPEKPTNKDLFPGRSRGSGNREIATPQKQPPDETQAQRPPDGQPARQPPPVPPAGGQPDAEPFAPAAGAYYVVIQHFAKSEGEAAEAARAYMAGEGVPCVVLSGADLQLVATQGFASVQDAQALVHKIAFEIGPNYRKTGGYNFAGASAKVLKTKPRS